MAGTAKARRRLTQTEIENLPALCDATDAMALTGFSRRYVCKLCNDGAFIATKLGKAWKINTRSLLAYAGLDQ